MRAFCMLLAVLLLEGCIATQSLQLETTEVARQAVQQCSETHARMDALITAQDEIINGLERETKALERETLAVERETRAIERETKARQAMTISARVDQSCPELRKSLNNKTVVGAVEWALIDFGSYQSISKARMDTGASTSSINARNITEFERNGKRWVRFTLADDQEVSLLLERYADIRQASAEKDKRWVVKLGIKLGTISQVAEFTLKDRSHLNYNILVGRNLLRDLMVVDVARRYVLGKKPQSPTKKSPAKKAPDNKSPAKKTPAKQEG
ncbi:MAG: RimK/LysX family protein [Amphritea sp.]